MNTPALPRQLPPSMPQLRSHVGRRLARWFVTRCGWKLRGDFPEPRREHHLLHALTLHPKVHDLEEGFAVGITILQITSLLVQLGNCRQNLLAIRLDFERREKAPDHDVAVSLVRLDLFGG